MNPHDIAKNDPALAHLLRQQRLFANRRAFLGQGMNLLGGVTMASLMGGMASNLAAGEPAKPLIDARLGS